MNDEKKKAAPVVVHRDGEGEQIALPGFTLSESKHNTGSTEKQGFIAALVPVGSSRAVSLRRLAEMAGLSERAISARNPTGTATGYSDLF